VGDTGVVDENAGVAKGGADLARNLGDDIRVSNVALEVGDLWQ
jgi:hypothetical protein